MHFHKNLSALFFSFFLYSTSGGALAADIEDAGRAFVIESSNHDFIVNKDGSFVATIAETVRIATAQGVTGRSQWPLSYNQTLETIEVLEAYTEKADGSRKQVQPGQIKDQQEPRSVGAPMFQDTRVKVLVYPDVAVGDKLVLRYRLKQHTALFPGHFATLQVPELHPHLQYSVSVDAPAAMTLNTDAFGFEVTSPVIEDGRKRMQWNWRPHRRARLESGSVAYSDYGDHLAISSFADYAAFAQTYESRSADKVLVTPAIRALAIKTVTGIDDTRKKVLALTNWVRTHIRYVAVYVGPGGVVPHATDAILDNAYGDCKDHVALLEALLNAIGIESTPALINSGNAHRLYNVPTLGIFNHVITYVPSLDLYLDSTAAHILAGYLPAQDMDKPTLLTKSGKLARTPVLPKVRLTAQSTLVLSPDGSAALNQSLMETGWSANSGRVVLTAIDSANRNLVVSKLLSNIGLQGEGTLNGDEAASSDDAYTVRIDAQINSLGDLPGPVGVATPSSLVGGIHSQVVNMLSEKSRTQAWECTTKETEEEVLFELPATVSITAVPQPVSVKSALIDYDASYTRDGNRVTVKRRLNFHHASAVCSAEEFRREVLPPLIAIARDLRAQILVQPR